MGRFDNADSGLPRQARDKHRGSLFRRLHFADYHRRRCWSICSRSCWSPRTRTCSALLCSLSHRGVDIRIDTAIFDIYDTRRSLVDTCRIRLWGGGSPRFSHQCSHTLFTHGPQVHDAADALHGLGPRLGPCPSLRRYKGQNGFIVQVGVNDVAAC